MKIPITIALTAMLSGCYSIGNQQISNPDIVAQIVPGETTKTEVVDLVGRPTTVDFDENEREKWLYSYTITKVSGRQLIPIFGMFAGPDVETRSLTILFDDNDIVRKVGGGAASSKDSLQGAGRAADESKQAAKKKNRTPRGKRHGGGAS